MSEIISEFLRDKTELDPDITDEECIKIAAAAVLAERAAFAYRVLQGRVDAVRPLDFLDPREGMARRLLMQGHASVDEILESSFGEWPPKGLDIVSDNPQRVTFQSQMAASEGGTIKSLLHTKTKDLLSDTFGSAGLGGERVMRVNEMRLSLLPGLLGRSALSSTLGHEGVHILQGDNYFRAAQIYGYEGALETRIYASYQDDMNSNIANRWVFERLRNTEFLDKLSDADLRHFQYLEEGIEIQARMHEALMQGYTRWGQLPANKEQLLVAMADIGLDPVPEVMAELETSPTIEETRRIFSGGAGVKTLAVEDLNHLQKGLTADGRSTFWQEALPETYADLIEMYGDGPGRERFGLGINARRAVREEIEVLRRAGHVAEASYDAYEFASSANRPHTKGLLEPGALSPQHIPPKPYPSIAAAFENVAELAEKAKSLKMAGTAAKVGKVGIVTTVALTGAAVVLTDRANAAVLDVADKLHMDGKLSDAAYLEYTQMMDEVGTMLTMQAADPFPTAIPGMIIVESEAHKRFQQFSNKYDLPQDMHAMLSPALTVGKSLRAKFADEIRNHLPGSADEMPPALEKLMEAKLALDAAKHEAMKASIHTMSDAYPLNPLAGTSAMGDEIFARAIDKVQAAAKKYQTSFDETLSDPAKVSRLLAVMPDRQKANMIAATAQYSAPEDLSGPVRQLVKTQEALQAYKAENRTFHSREQRIAHNGTLSRLNHDIRQAEKALLKDTGAMNAYLVDRFTSDQKTPAAAEKQKVPSAISESFVMAHDGQSPRKALEIPYAPEVTDDVPKPRT